MQIPVSELIPVLQTAIGPMILISGVGLLILTLTNRLGRVIDRARIIAARDRETKSEQLMILWHRAHLIRNAIALIASSALFASILIVLLFITALFRLENSWLIGSFFIFCMLSLISGLVFFLLDINLSLTALRLELEQK
jgi:hypothetical protein